MMQENLKLFNIFRKRDINLDVAVSSSKGSINAYLFEVGSGVNTNQLKNLLKNGKIKLIKIL